MHRDFGIRSQILDARGDAKKQKDDEKQPDQAHSPHHSHRHVSHLHHIQPLPLIGVGAGRTRVLSAAMPMAVLWSPIVAVAAQRVVAGNLLARQQRPLSQVGFQVSGPEIALQDRYRVQLRA